MRRICLLREKLIFFLLSTFPPAFAQDAVWPSEFVFRRTLSGYETWFVESPRGDLAVAGLAHQGPVVILERSTGLVLRELSPNAQAFCAAFSDDQDLLFVAERYVLKVYEVRAGRLRSVHGVEIGGPDIAVAGRILFLRGRINGSEGLFRLDPGGPGTEEAGTLTRVSALPPGIVLGGTRAAAADKDPLPSYLRKTFSRVFPPRVVGRLSAAVLAEGAVVLLDLRTGRPERVLDLDGSEPQLFETDYFGRIGAAYAPKGSDHYLHLWRLDSATAPAVQRPEHSYPLPLHPVSLAISDSGTEAWISGFRGGRDIGGGRIIETVDAAGLLDLRTGAWKESAKDAAPSWAVEKTGLGVEELVLPGRLRYRMLDHGVIEARDPKTGEALVYLRVDGRGEWAAFTPGGRWDASPGALGSLLYRSDGLRTWAPDPARDGGFTPGLVQALAEAVESIRLSVNVDRGEGGAYRIGEELTVLVSVDRPVWLRLYHIQADGTAELIWPNNHDFKQWIPAGADQRIPAADDRYSFTIRPPLGKESILAFASTRPFLPGHPGLPDTGEPDHGPSIPRGMTEPESWPEASASARIEITVFR